MEIEELRFSSSGINSLETFSGREHKYSSYASSSHDVVPNYVPDPQNRTPIYVILYGVGNIWWSVNVTDWMNYARSMNETIMK